MGKRPKQCEYCGRTFTPSKGIHKYCSDRCRKKAHKERQKKAIEAHKKQTPRPQPRKIYESHISAADLRSRLIKLRARGLLSPEYWTLYQEVDKTYYNGSGVVNGVSVNDKNFVEEVLAHIYVDGRVECWTQGNAINEANEKED